MIPRKMFKQFIEKEAKDGDLCKDYKDYSYEVQKMLCNIYACCYRFNLYKKQIIFILNLALEPFKEKREDEELFNL